MSAPVQLSWTTAPHGRGWPHYALGLALNALGYALLAPPIAAFHFFALTTPDSHLNEALEASAFEPGAVILAFFGWVKPGLLTAYEVGAIPAALAGVGAAIASSWLDRALVFYPVAAAAGALAGLLPAAQAGAFGDEPAALLMPACGALAALIAAWMFGLLRLHRDSSFTFSRQTRRDRAAKARSERVREARLKAAKTR